MNFDEARSAVLNVLRQQGKVRNSEILALLGGDAALLARVREDLFFEELAEDVRGAGLRNTAQVADAPDAARTTLAAATKIFLSDGRRATPASWPPAWKPTCAPTATRSGAIPGRLAPARTGRRKSPTILSEASCRADPASAFERGVLTPLQQLHALEDGHLRFLLVDALDEALLVPLGQPDLVSLLCSRLDRLSPWLRLVAATRREPAVLDHLAGLPVAAQGDPVPPASRRGATGRAARARGPGLARGVLAGRESSGQRIEGWNRPAVGCAHRRMPGNRAGEPSASPPSGFTPSCVAARPF